MDYHDVHSITPCQCPKCRAERSYGSSGQPPSRYNYSSSQRGRGKKATILSIIAVMTIAGGIYFVNPFNIQFPTLVVPDIEDENAEPVESSDDSVPEQEPEVQQVTEIEGERE